jgi:hypothetical protein
MLVLKSVAIWPKLKTTTERGKWRRKIMAHTGTGYFDSRGQYFRSPIEATVSDLAGLLGRVGEGESLAPGIAHMMLEKRAEIERIFADHDSMLAVEAAQRGDDSKVLPLRPAR